MPAKDFYPILVPTLQPTSAEREKPTDAIACPLPADFLHSLHAKYVGFTWLHLFRCRWMCNTAISQGDFALRDEGVCACSIPRSFGAVLCASMLSRLDDVAQRTAEACTLVLGTE